jgi:serine/threonine-protein kinase
MNDASNSNDWARIEAIFDEAHELPPGERASFLDEACGTDGVLRREVEALLAAADRPGPLDRSLDEVAGAIAAEATRPPSADAALGRRVGPWRLIDDVGAGGMGRVFLAERVEGGYEQRAALKILRWELATPQLVDRFTRERQILARLESPAIARLIDGGVTEDGLPYLAMEYVEGEPIDAWCRNEGADLDRRLDLFVDVAEAVDTAHRNLVVHRDLKPSNILVDREGRVRLLDFGVASIVDEASPDARLTHTRLAPATPSCAAPEQLTGGAITTATDVWALGVLLYELLTDEHPFDLDGPTHEITARVLGAEIVAPSRRVRGDARRRLRGDLDNIVSRALAREPSERYGSVSRLVDDLRRHRAGLPVSARAATWRYRMAKAIGRHRRAVTAAAVLVVLIASLTGFHTWRLARERDRALAEQRKAEEVTAFVQSLFESNDPIRSQGEEISARELLDRGAERIETELVAQPAVAGEMHHVVGQLYSKLGDYRSAHDHLERAADLRREALGPYAVPLAESLDQLGTLRQTLDDLDGAIEAQTEALGIRRRHPDDPVGLARSLNELGLTLSYRGDYEEAERRLREAYDLRIEVSGPNHPSTATVLGNLGLAIKWSGDFDRAEPIYRQVLSIREENPGRMSPEYAISLDNLGVLLGQRGDYEESEECFREALRIRRRILGEDHPDVAMNLNNLATLFRVQGRLDVAEPIYREVLALNRRIHGDGHRTVATNLHNLASVLTARGDHAGADSCLTAVLEIRRRVFGDDHIEVAMARNELVNVLLPLGELERADEESAAAVRTARTSVDENSAELASALANRGRVLLELDRPLEARRVLERSLAARRATLAADHWETGTSAALLGESLLRLGDAAAESLLVEGHEILRSARGDDFVFTQRARAVLRDHYRATGRIDEARSLDSGPGER